MISWPRHNKMNTKHNLHTKLQTGTSYQREKSKLILRGIRQLVGVSARFLWQPSKMKILVNSKRHAWIHLGVRKTEMSADAPINDA